MGRLAIAVQNCAPGTNVPEAAKLRRWIRHALAGEADGELVLRIVGAEESAALNRRYRNREGATNVLAFAAEAPSLPDEGELAPFGDLVVCAEVLEREASAQGKSLEAHWAHIVIHGALHLIGYDHDTADTARTMERRERDLLAALGFPDPYV